MGHYMYETLCKFLMNEASCKGKNVPVNFDGASKEVFTRKHFMECFKSCQGVEVLRKFYIKGDSY